MTEVLLGIVALLSGAYLFHLMYRRIDQRMRIVLPGSPMHRADRKRDIPWHTPRVPVDATHIAWIMLGEGEAGRVHTLYLQTLAHLRQEVESAQSPWGPIIANSIELELDIRGRGCVPISEVMYAVARVDADGSEQWLGKQGDWVSRWSEAAEIFEVFPGQIR